MKLNDRINAFVSLGEFLQQFYQKEEKGKSSVLNELFYDDFTELIEIVHHHNQWFTESNVRSAIKGIGETLKKEKLEEWVEPYNALMQEGEPKRVGVVMAGNIPMVGFNDMLCVLTSGNVLVGKLSSNDNLLLPFMAKVLIAIDARFKESIEFTKDQLQNIDVIIATGSDNTARHFEYYFSKYPSIIRKNRNSIAVISGDETKEELKELGKDIFQYFGLGCRNVSKLHVPKGYKFDGFYEAIYDYKDIINNNKYGNNYEYNRTVFLMGDNSDMLDNNFLILKGGTGYTSPIGVLFYEHYDDITKLNAQFEADEEQIQCIVSKNAQILNAIEFGQSQCPTLSDYADGVDTMDFLLKLE